MNTRRKETNLPEHPRTSNWGGSVSTTNSVAKCLLHRSVRLGQTRATLGTQVYRTRRQRSPQSLSSGHRKPGSTVSVR
ncbi:hypothetical protein RRG08_057835 [Elysia crispata]|uniref:Uncharacterized protein n=1 Tax=Elysia crispata TaxID=231223 RepID=A0AAE1AZL6_9GAST|nr:hypothetical protein RRG08_057835 [Elysia crispata]